MPATPIIQASQNMSSYANLSDTQVFRNSPETIYEFEQDSIQQSAAISNIDLSTSVQQSLQATAQPVRKPSTTQSTQIDHQVVDPSQGIDCNLQSTPSTTQQQKQDEPKEKVESEKMSRRREQIFKCMKGFDDVSFPQQLRLSKLNFLHRLLC